MSYKLSILNEILILIDGIKGGYHSSWSERSFVFHPYDRRLWKRIPRSEWEPETLEWLKKNISKGTVFMDVGAWVGPTTIWANFCGARVVALEPDPIAYERLLFNVNHNNLKDVFTIHGGLSGSNGNFKISSARGLGKSMSKMHFDERHAQGAPGANEVLVAGIDLETTMKFSGIDRIDILKMDIEGGEFHVFPAIVDKILSLNVKKVMLSLHGKALSEEDFTKLAPALIESTKKFKRLVDKNGNDWAWDAVRMKEFRSKYTEIILS